MSLTSLTDEPRALVSLRRASREATTEWRDAATYRARAMALILAATVARFVCLAPLPLGNGEAYYYSWSRFLDWSYYDHPPLVAWMVRLTTVFGASPAAVRFGPVVAAGLFGLLFHRLAERFLRPRAAFLALVLVTALPVFAGSSFVLNPEAPLAPLWVGYLLAVDRMRDRDQWYHPLLAGALLGCAFLAKYTAVLLVPTTLLYVAASAPTRRWLRRPSFYAAGAVALLIAAPVLAWNQARGWPSVRLHLMERTSVGVPVAGENTLNTLVAISSSHGTGLIESLVRVGVGQLLSYSPLLAPFLVIGLVQLARRARRDDRDLFLASFSWPVLVVLLAAMTFIKDAEQHWTMMAFVPAAMAAGRYLDEQWNSARLVRWVATAGVALSAAVFLLLNIHVRTTALLRLWPHDHYDARADITNELLGWNQVRASLGQAVVAAPGRVVLASNHYAMCARMLFETGDQPPVYCPTARRTAFDFMDRHDPPANATVIALTTDIHDEMPPGLRDRTCRAPEEVDIDRAGIRVARYFVHTCPPVRSESNVRASR